MSWVQYINISGGTNEFKEIDSIPRNQSSQHGNEKEIECGREEELCIVGSERKFGYEKAGLLEKWGKERGRYCIVNFASNRKWCRMGFPLISWKPLFPALIPNKTKNVQLSCRWSHVYAFSLVSFTSFGLDFIFAVEFLTNEQSAPCSLVTQNLFRHSKI